jgi:hypothetical protein
MAEKGTSGPLFFSPSSPVGARPIVTATDKNESRTNVGIALKIPSARTTRVAGKKVTFYTIESYKLGGNQERGEVEHRYSEFAELNKILTARFGRQVPEFLVARNKLFTDHFTDSFIEDRRLLLEDWLRRCASSPAIRDSTEIINFLLLKTESKVYGSNTQFGNKTDLPTAKMSANIDEKPVPMADKPAPSAMSKFSTAVAKKIKPAKPSASGITDDDL